MRKRIPFLICFALCLLLLTGCQCEHEWYAATCTTAKTCGKCGETEGTTLAHDWMDATCTEAKTCSVCAKTEGKPLGHKGGSWTKTTDYIQAEIRKEEVCTVCNAILDSEITMISPLAQDDRFLFSPMDFASRLDYLFQDTFSQYSCTYDCMLDERFVISLSHNNSYFADIAFWNSSSSNFLTTLKCMPNDGCGSIAVFIEFDFAWNFLDVLFPALCPGISEYEVNTRKETMFYDLSSKTSYNLPDYNLTLEVQLLDYEGGSALYVNCIPTSGKTDNSNNVDDTLTAPSSPNIPEETVAAPDFSQLDSLIQNDLFIFTPEEFLERMKSIALSRYPNFHYELSGEYDALIGLIYLDKTAKHDATVTFCFSDTSAMSIDDIHSKDVWCVSIGNSGDPDNWGTLLSGDLLEIFYNACDPVLSEEDLLLLIATKTTTFLNAYEFGELQGFHKENNILYEYIYLLDEDLGLAVESVLAYASDWVSE